MLGGQRSKVISHNQWITYKFVYIILSPVQKFEQHEATAVEETSSRPSTEFRILDFCTTNKTGKSVHFFWPASTGQVKKRREMYYN